MKTGVFVFLTFSLVVACQSGNVKEIGKKSIDSIPMEYVDAETNGRKGGGTHFSLTSTELFFDYENFEDEFIANARLESVRTNAAQVLEEGNVLAQGDVIAGKFLVARHENERFCLTWSRANRYSSVCSESKQAIEEFRTVYKL
jgi:hypothetical protein